MFLDNVQIEQQVLFLNPQSKPPVVTSSSAIARKVMIQNNTTSNTPVLNKITQCEKVLLSGPKREDGWKCLWCKTPNNHLMQQRLYTIL